MQYGGTASEKLPDPFNFLNLQSVYSQSVYSQSVYSQSAFFCFPTFYFSAAYFSAAYFSAAYFSIALARRSSGNFSIAYLREVLGISVLFFMTYSKTSCRWGLLASFSIQP